MRNVPTDLITALNQSTCSPYYAVEFLTDDNDNTRWDQVGYTGENALRFWTGIGSRTINSESRHSTSFMDPIHHRVLGVICKRSL